MLVQSKLAISLKKFILELNTVEQVDKDKAINQFCSRIESEVYAAIKSATIVLPPGSIVVMTGNGPASNVTPLTINLALK